MERSEIAHQIRKLYWIFFYCNVNVKVQSEHKLISNRLIASESIVQVLLYSEC